MIRYYVFTPDGTRIACEPCGELALPYMTPGRVMLRGTEEQAEVLCRLLVDASITRGLEAARDRERNDLDEDRRQSVRT